MSDTPRTDKAEFEIGAALEPISSSSRQLERELATVTKERDALRTALARLHDVCEIGQARDWYLREAGGQRSRAMYALGAAKGGSHE